MVADPARQDEAARLAALRRYCVLDTARETRFDELARIAALVCDTPVALVSFVDSTRLFFKAAHGIDAREVPYPDGFCAHAVRQRGFFEIPDTHQDMRFAHHPLVTEPPRVRFYAGMPLVTPDDFGLGTLCVIDFQPRMLPPEHREMLSLLAKQVMTQLELGLQAMRDPLTGLYNRRPLEEHLQREIVRARRKSDSVGLMAIDADHFKRVNEAFGHEGGDTVLRALARCLLECAGEEDVVCRVGADEFAITLPGVGKAVLLQHAELVRRKIEQTPIAVGAADARVTASVGVAVYPQHGLDAAELLGAAGAALHRAKGAGGNRVVMGGPEGTQASSATRR